MARHDPAADLFLNAYQDDSLAGSITIDRTITGDGGAHLGWFIVRDGLRNAGLGRTLMTRALSFCDTRGYGRV